MVGLGCLKIKHFWIEKYFSYSSKPIKEEDHQQKLNSNLKLVQHFKQMLQNLMSYFF